MLPKPDANESVPFEDLVQQATRLVSAKHRIVNGRDTIVVELQFDKVTDPNITDDPKYAVEIHFDPALNYLVRKRKYTRTTSIAVHFMEDEALEFRELSPGLFFPERTAGRSGRVADPDFDYAATISEMKLNQPLPPEVLKFRFPNGMYISDTVRGEFYHVDAEGNKVSKSSPIDRAAPPPRANEVIRPLFGTETEEEPKSWTRFLIPVSLAVLALAAVVALLRRRKRAASAS
jgi:hypothetical protein